MELLLLLKKLGVCVIIISPINKNLLKRSAHEIIGLTEQ